MKLAILQGLLSDASGGLAASVPAMVRALADETQIEPHVVGIFDRAVRTVSADWGAFSHACRAYGPAAFHWAPAMAKTLGRLAPDVIDTHGVWMNLSRIALARHKSHGTPLVITPHGMLDPWALQRSRWRKRLVRYWFEDDHFARAGAIRALNADEAQSVRQFGARSPVVIIPNGIDSPDAERVTDVEEREPVLQFLGRLDPKKGLEPLFAAWSLVAREPSARDWRLRINGWGAPDYMQRLHGIVSEFDTGNSLLLGGPVFGAEKEAVLGSSGGFVLPSFSEGLPMAVLEAWAWGTPVLMTRKCNLPEGFAAGAALEVTTEPKELARRILDYIGMSAHERRAMAIAGRRLVETKFHARAVARDLERLYGWLHRGGTPPSDLVFDR